MLIIVTNKDWAISMCIYVVVSVSTLPWGGPLQEKRMRRRKKRVCGASGAWCCRRPCPFWRDGWRWHLRWDERRRSVRGDWDSPATGSWRKRGRHCGGGTTGISIPCRNWSTCRALRPPWPPIHGAQCRQIRPPAGSSSSTAPPRLAPASGSRSRRDSPGRCSTTGAFPSLAFFSQSPKKSLPFFLILFLSLFLFHFFIGTAAALKMARGEWLRVLQKEKGGKRYE